MSATSSPSSVKPRHVLCFLGRKRALALLSAAASDAIGRFASGFSVDTTYSQDEPDARMNNSFAVCWDRIEPNGWTPDDEAAVANHKSVLYVLGPPMSRDDAVDVSAVALKLVEALIDAGAIAVKGESAGVSHGLARWRELNSLAGDAKRSGDRLSVSRTCRLAFSRRPLENVSNFESVGFHLVGLPEVYVAKNDRSDPAAAAIMDSIADEMAQRSLEEVLRDHKATISFKTIYRPDDFKFNPYGIVYVGQD